MKTTKSRLFLHKSTQFAAGVLALAAGLLATNTAEAHISYTGRDFGSYSGLTSATTAITNQTCTGNFGWADAADGILGDSHKGRAFRFHLDNGAFVSLTVAANPLATTNNPLGDLTPAFSIYAGLAAIAPFPPTQTALPSSPDHDSCDASLVWRAWWEQQHLGGDGTTNNLITDGSWNAVGDWKIGGDGDLPGDFAQLSSFTYQGSAASTTSGGSVTGSLALPAGDYTIFIGGNDIANKTADTAALARGISATLTVSPTPAIFITPKVFLALPTGDTNWVLESTPSFGPTNWTAVPYAPITVDGQRGVLLDSGAAAQFFRLRSNP